MYSVRRAGVWHHAARSCPSGGVIGMKYTTTKATTTACADPGKASGLDPNDAEARDNLERLK
jgi:hypothetical protein